MQIKTNKSTSAYKVKGISNFSLR